jgi:tetrahydromethanopterin S-methyltransferase subunit G
MKKSASAPLCSAFVIPGLGQIINQDIGKGLGLLASVFILLILGVVKIVLILNAALETPSGTESAAGAFIDRFLASDFTLLWGIVAAFFLVWLYSVIDAFFRGRQRDREDGEESP